MFACTAHGLRYRALFPTTAATLVIHIGLLGWVAPVAAGDMSSLRDVSRALKLANEPPPVQSPSEANEQDPPDANVAERDRQSATTGRAPAGHGPDRPAAPIGGQTSAATPLPTALSPTVSQLPAGTQTLQPAPPSSIGAAAAAPPSSPEAGSPTVTSAAPVEPNPAVPTLAGVAASLAKPSPDYYGERAKKLLALEKKAKDKPHPLQLAAPDYDVLVCEAGCMEQGARVVAKHLKSETISAKAPIADVTSSPSGLNMTSAGITCVAGCSYSASGSKVASANPDVPPLKMGRAADNWLTTIGRSVDAVPPAAVAPTQAAPSLTAVAGPKPAAKAVSSEDWMARINRDRAQKAGQAAPSNVAPTP